MRHLNAQVQMERLNELRNAIVLKKNDIQEHTNLMSSICTMQVIPNMMNRHNSQINYLTSYLEEKVENFKQLEHHQRLVELVLYAKYAGEGYGYDKFQQHFDEQYNHDIENLSQQEGCGFFRIVRDVNQLIDLQTQMGEIDEELLKLRYFYASSQTGRDMAYRDMQDGEMITLRNPETLVDEQYVVKNIVPLRLNGEAEEISLKGFTYTPAVASEYPIVYISWRGSSSQESWLSDTQLTAGIESYISHERQILHQINQVIESAVRFQGQPVHLFVTGHSLGGALSQLTFNSLQRALLPNGHRINAQFIQGICDEFKGSLSNEQRQNGFLESLKLCLVNSCQLKLNLGLIASMHLGVWNSPGVLNSVAQSSDQCAAVLTTQHRIPQNGYFVFVEGDLVQTAGCSTALSGLDTNQANVEILILKNDQLSWGSKCVGVAGGAMGGAVIASSALTAPALIGGLAGASVVSLATGYGIAISHRTQLFTDEGRIITDMQTLTGYEHLLSQTDGTKCVERLRDKSVILRWLSTLMSRFDSLQIRVEMQQLVTKHVASCQIKRCMQRHTIKRKKQFIQHQTRMQPALMTVRSFQNGV